MSAPSSSTYAATYGGLMRWPANGMLMIANVVTVPLSGSSMNSSSCCAGRRIGFPRREVHLPVLARARAEQLALLEPAQERALGKRSGVLDLDAARADQHGHRIAVVGLALGFGVVAEREVGDVGDRADRLVDPVRVHPRAGADVVGGAGIDRVQQRGVRAVELDQRPRERAVQRLALQRLRLPRPRHHGPDAAHRYDLGQSFVGDGVELGRRHMHPPVRTAHADDASLAQGGEELADRSGPTERV